MEHKMIRAPFTGFGARQLKDGVYFAASLSQTGDNGVAVYDLLTKERILSFSFDDSMRYGNVYAVVIKGLDLKGRGYRFISNGKELPDRYSTIIYGNETFGSPVHVNDLIGGISGDSSPKGFAEDRPLFIPYEDTVLYLAHVRGLTKADTTVRSGSGTFKGIVSKIPYLKDLGVTSLLLMPVYEFIEKEALFSASDLSKAKDTYRDKDGEKNLNYWGFCKAFPYAVKTSYASTKDPSYEFKNMVLKLHLSGLECLITVYSDIFDSEEELAHLLRYYVERFHVDGFRIVGDNRFAKGLIQDPFLKGSKLLFDNLDTGVVMDEGIPKVKNTAVISSDFKRQSRRFLKSDEETVSFMSYAVRENPKYFSPVRDVTDYEGFTLWDLYSFSRKHNDSNNEDNRDGSNYNYSWNCGAEGETAKRSVIQARLKQCRNAMLVSFLSQGVPMITAGDEFLNSAKGNNNTYCQDNETGWLTDPKKRYSREFKQFLKNLIAFRKRHVILHQKSELMLFDYMSCKVPDVSFHSVEAWRIDQDPASREFAVLFAGQYAKQYTGEPEDSVYVIYNMNWEAEDFVLPVQGPGVVWSLVYSSDGSTDSSFDESKAKALPGGKFTAGERTVSVLLLRKTDLINGENSDNMT